MFIFPVQLTTSRIGNLTRLIHTLLYVMTIHTYIHTMVVDDARSFQESYDRKYNPLLMIILVTIVCLYRVT